jgi:hypothetical protein
MGIRIMVQRMMKRRPGCNGAENKDKQACDHAQNRAGHSQSRFVLPVHEDLLSQRRASGKPYSTWIRG